MMKRLLCLALAAVLTLSLVEMAPTAMADTYGQADNTVSMAGSVAVDVTNSYVNVRSGPGTNYAVVSALAYLLPIVPLASYSTVKPLILRVSVNS